MKTLVLGDTHGRSDWQRIVHREQSHDLNVVFVGDYFDTHEDISAPHQIANFQEILEFKRTWRDGAVTLLVGNHDFHYMRASEDEQYSGYNRQYAAPIERILSSALVNGELQIGKVIDGKYLVTHAGLTKTWAKNHKIDLRNVDQSLQELFINDPKAYGFYWQDYSHYGDDIRQGPLWVRPTALLEDRVTDYQQIVGHTTMKKIVEPIPTEKSPYFIDVLGTSGEYLLINNGKVTIKQWLKL